MTERAELIELLEKSKARYDAMSPKQKAEMHRQQAESWARAFAPCEHGVRDWEECAQCRAEFRALEAKDPANGHHLSSGRSEGGE